MLYFTLINDNIIGPSDDYQPLVTRFYYYQLSVYVSSVGYINWKKIEFELCEIPDFP